MGDFGQELEFHFDEHGILWYGDDAYVRVPEAAATIMRQAREGPVRFSINEAEAIFQDEQPLAITAAPDSDPEPEPAVPDTASTALATTALATTALAPPTSVPITASAMKIKIAGIIDEIARTPKKIEAFKPVVEPKYNLRRQEAESARAWEATLSGPIDAAAKRSITPTSAPLVEPATKPTEKIQAVKALAADAYLQLGQIDTVLSSTHVDAMVRKTFEISVPPTPTVKPAAQVQRDVTKSSLAPKVEAAELVEAALAAKDEAPKTEWLKKSAPPPVYTTEELYNMRNLARLSPGQTHACDEFNREFHFRKLPHAPRAASRAAPRARRNTKSKEVLNRLLLDTTTPAPSQENKPKYSPAWGILNPAKFKGRLYELEERTNRATPSCHVCGGAHATDDCGWIKRLS